MSRIGRAKVIGGIGGAGSANTTYFGTGVDGDISISSGETYKVNIVEDAETAILQCKSLNIDSGGVLTTSGRCPGLIIQVQKDCTINGTINMDKKSPLECTNYEDLKLHPCIVLFGSPSGGAGGSGGNTGGGAGGSGDCFGGGYGGGGGGGYAGGSSNPKPPVGINWPYPGTNSNGSYGAGGGAGGTAYGGAAPGGGGASTYRYYNQNEGVDRTTYNSGGAGDAYGGGAIYLYVKGNLTIGSSAILSAQGGKGGAGASGGYHSVYSDGTASRDSWTVGSGGSGGGGVICIAYEGTLVNGGSLKVGGGAANTTGTAGTAGSVGYTSIQKFSEMSQN